MEFLRMIFRYRYQKNKNASIIESTVELWMQKNATEIFNSFHVSFTVKWKTHTLKCYLSFKPNKNVSLGVFVLFMSLIKSDMVHGSARQWGLC